ncbi:hypothetical protein B0J13DRAFT_625676 [Dactylonectria estremocensis]|uniref:Uncharacterized protein n=1 Tax=Dactylonectria estremocensis TaxID=1079267 RepID=A0A9P9EH96_9HYPO|nr:hypothetical protein B0J13DRAFT_625676 [Dactylonectria estremocensis]
MDWSRGLLALNTALTLYIPRSPLQLPFASQSNLQAVATTHIATDHLMEQWLQAAHAAKAAHDDARSEAYKGSVVALVAEEVAHLYHEHMISKIKGTILTTQQIVEVYYEAWMHYSAHRDQEVTPMLPPEIPN